MKINTKKLYDRSNGSSIKDYLLKILYNFQIVFNTDLLLHTYYFLNLLKKNISMQKFFTLNPLRSFLFQSDVNHIHDFNQMD